MSGHTLIRSHVVQGEMMWQPSDNGRFHPTPATPECTECASQTTVRKSLGQVARLKTGKNIMSDGRLLHQIDSGSNGCIHIHVYICIYYCRFIPALSSWWGVCVCVSHRVCKILSKLMNAQYWYVFGLGSIIYRYLYSAIDHC